VVEQRVSGIDGGIFEHSIEQLAQDSTHMWSPGTQGLEIRSSDGEI
jgi:hypothetical protein